jgi:hypothetical protein
METDAYAPIISVCGLVIVAILSGLVPAYLDWIRAKRERVAAERERIREAAVRLLRNLANFRNLEGTAQAESAGLCSVQQVSAEMRGAYDAWALVVMPRLDVSQQKGIEEIREKELGRENLKNTEAQDMSLSKELFRLTRTAYDKVQ